MRNIAPKALKIKLISIGCIPGLDGEFQFEDFVGTSDQARENCKLIFGLERISGGLTQDGFWVEFKDKDGGKERWHLIRHAMIDQPPGEEWNFLEETMVKK